jgi:hypothetical protein|tara:strand:- start:1099 stop:1785 length:687 start_codon:yes stop_codon:yes gene_type:complete
MGLFDIFKDEENLNGLGICHGLDLREWNDGYESDEKKIIQFVNNSIDEMSYQGFLSMLKKRDSYRKFTDQELSGKMNKMFITKSLNDTVSIIPDVKYIYYPSIFLDLEHEETPTGYRILDTDQMYDGESLVSGKFKTLAIISFNNNQDYWGKKINSDKPIRSVGFQFVDLDDDEYDLIKANEKDILKENLVQDAWGKMHVDIYNGLFKTEKRKKYPINRFQTYLIFKE